MTAKYLLLGVAFSGLLAGTAHAQTASADATAEEAATEAAIDSNEIVVTANKREQRLNDVGITVAVVSGDDLKDRQIVNLQDLAQAVPGLNYTNTANGTPVFTLRGVGFNESSLASYPTVSVYLDQAPLVFGVLTRHSAYDLERVEVLKGPQGTLFGQNSTGGAINYIAAQPTNTLTAGGSISYGRFNQIIGEAYVSGPLSDTLKARVVGRIEHADDWQISQTRPNDRNGKVRNYMGRLILDFEPSDTIRFNLNVNGWKDKSDTQAPQFIGRSPQNPVLSPAFINAPFAPNNARIADWTPGLPFSDNSMWQTVLRADIDLSSDITLTSLTGYVDYKQRQGNEGEALPLSAYDIPTDIGRIKSLTQELRLSNGGNGPFRWVVGGNLEHSSVDQLLTLFYPDSSIGLTLGTFFGYPISELDYTSNQKMRNYAGFANVEYDLTDQLTLKLGGRYTRAKTSVEACSVATDSVTNGTGAFFYDILLGGAFGPYQTGDCYPINSLPVAVGGVAPGAPGAYTGTLKEDNISWRAGLDYKVTPDVLLYVNVSRGYKGGGYPAVSASTFQQYLPYRQESVLAYEGGLKATLLDRALQLNAAAFFYDYSDKQLRARIIDPVFGRLEVLQNVPKSTIKGFELEMTARPSDRLTVTAAFTYIDSSIDQFVGINGAGLQGDFSGTPIPFTPKYQVGVNADYSAPISGSLEGFLGAGINFRSDTSSVIGGDGNPPGLEQAGSGPIYKIADYALVDLRAGVKAEDGQWQLSVFGKNVFDKFYWNNVSAAQDSVIRYAGQPATYGVELRFKM